MSLHRTPLIAAAVTAAAFAMPSIANAAVTPTFDAGTAKLTVTGDAAADTIALAQNAANNITVNGVDTGAPADGSVDLVINAGDGNDTTTFATSRFKSVTIDGGPGDDLLNGSDLADVIHGGDGNDRIVAAKNPATADDQMFGDAGNDVLVWNNGEGTDDMDGGAGADEIEVNGAPTAGDQFTAKPDGSGGVRFDRTNLGLFGLNIKASEKLTINGLGGDDTVTPQAGLAPLIAIVENGGAGNDTLNGSDGNDVLNGGDGNDVLSGGPGADRVTGDRGADTQSGGAGDDTLVWNNGDGSDKSDGDDGLDRIEVNGAPTGDAFTLTPNGARTRFDRTNLVPFSVDIGSSEAISVNGLGGDDAFTVAPGAASQLAVTADGGPGNDVLTGAEGAETFFGGSGDDRLTGGGGADVLDAQDGNDALLARDGAADLLRGGAGIDSAQTDAPGVDVLDGIETVDPAAAPAPADTKASPLSVLTRRATVKRGKVRLAVAAPASDSLTGTLTLVTAKPIKIGGVKVRAVLGSAKYALKAGERRTLTIKVPSRLARHALAARAQSTSTDAAGNVAVASSAVSLKAAK